MDLVAYCQLSPLTEPRLPYAGKSFGFLLCFFPPLSSFNVCSLTQDLGKLTAVDKIIAPFKRVSKFHIPANTSHFVPGV